MTASTVEAVLDDWRTAPVDGRMKATLGFLEKLTLTPADIQPEDVELLRAQGVSDQAIEDAIYVCCLFNIINRLADAFDFEIGPMKSLTRISRILHKIGYSVGSIPG